MRKTEICASVAVLSPRRGSQPRSIERGYSGLATLFAVFTLLLFSLPLFATPPSDPICRAPSSLDLVSTFRDQMAADAKGRRRLVGIQQLGVRPQLSIQRAHAFEPPRLVLEGIRGQTYHLESTSDLASVQWTSWLSVVLGDGPLSWSDEIPLTTSGRFFRLRAGEPDAFPDSVSNFRLLDHTGTARDLYYHTHLEAVAILAAGPNLDAIPALLPVLDEIAKTYTNKVQIWILLSDPAAIRSNVVAQTKELKINFPILLDEHGLAAGAVGLKHAGEVAVVEPPAFTVAYRGKVVGPTQSSADGSFLGQALASLKDDGPLTFLRTPVHGALLSNVAEETPDYARAIAPVVHKHCAICHRSNGVAPFALTNYTVVEQWAPAIKHAVLSGKMPPWHADPEYGHFANDLSLPGEFKSALIRWIDAGAPRGPGPDPLVELPPPPAFDRWPAELGEPDALVTIPRQQIKAVGSEPYRYLYTQSPNPTNVWLRAAIIRPSNYQAVHHYLVWPGRIGNSGGPDNSTYQAHIAEFVPGYKPFQIPADAYVPLAKSNWLTFNLHYSPYGVVTNDQPVLALWYHKAKPPKTWEVAGLVNNSFTIPAQAHDYPLQAEWTTPSRITVYRFNPHMHVRGKRMKYEVFYPGGTREILLSVPDYDFNWQIGYDLLEPKVLPAGSRIVASGAFDNSAQNLANPDPSARVRWGDQSWMEMFIGYIDYTR